MAAITDLHAREILDSRGNPTVEVDMQLEDGTFAVSRCTVRRIHRHVRSHRAP